MKCFDLTGRTAFVTGGNRGLGRAMAEGLAEAGANLFLVATNEASLEKACADIARNYGVKCAWAVANITDEPSVASAASKCVNAFGKIDVLINNAATDRVNLEPENTTAEQWRRVIDINVNGMFIVAKTVGAQMIAQGGGKIINMASICGYVLSRAVRAGSYDVSKHAVVALTRALAVEWSKHNIGVNAIAPGYFMTDPNREACKSDPALEASIASCIPMGRWGDPAELKGLAVFLASSASDYMQGSVVTADGGVTIV